MSTSKGLTPRSSMEVLTVQTMSTHYAQCNGCPSQRDMLPRRCCDSYQAWGDEVQDRTDAEALQARASPPARRRRC